MPTPSLSTRIHRKAFGARKLLHQALSRRPVKKKLVFIMGCQRSGTTLMSEVFHNDLDASSYGEFSALTTRNGVQGIRLNSLDIVQDILDKDRAALLVIKPLVESQRALELLDFFPGSKVLWLYRNYRDVANSNMNKFGLMNGIEDLRPIFNREPDNWRSEKVSADTQKIIDHYFSEQLKPADAQLLAWYARNILFFEQKLQHNSNVILCRYEDLTSSPSIVVQSIYQKLDRLYPGDKIVSEVHGSSVGKGDKLKFSPEIEKLGQQLLEELDSVYRARHYPFA